jgi:hypothetical protein
MTQRETLMAGRLAYGATNHICLVGPLTSTTVLRQPFFFYTLVAMTIRASKFTPEVLLAAPRRSEGIPNSDASKILYTIGAYSFSEHAKTSEVRVLDVASQQSCLVTDDKSVSEVAWLDDETILLLRSNEDGTTTILVGFPDSFEKRSVMLLPTLIS